MSIENHHRTLSLQALIIFLFSGLLSACFNEDGGETESSAIKTHSAETISSSVQQPPASPVLARIQQKQIQQDELDKSIQLELYDLDWAKYELRRKALANMVADALESGLVDPEQIHVLIEPPIPPRLEVPLENQPSHGADNAPVTIAIFCSYQSSHCARMQSVYSRLLEAYPEQIRYVFFDYPQPFHRFAQGASYAARCAEAKGEFWRFHKALWTDQSNLNNTFYQRIAKQLEIDPGEFAQCLEEQTYLPQVKSNFDLAQSYGFGNVPVTLVNGLYLKGPKTFDTLRYFVDRELERSAASSTSQTVASEPGTQKASDEVRMQRSELPLRLEGVVAGSGGDDANSAMITHLESGDSRRYGQDDEVLPAVFLVMIEADRVVLENNGQLEFLPVAGTTIAKETPSSMAGLYAQTNASGSSGASEAGEKSGELPPDMPPAEELEYTPRPVVEAKGETPLSRKWLEDQLLNQSELAAHFKPAAHEVEGVHLVKLRDVQDSEFYQTLGLQEGDVVMRVNDEWVHEAQNPLFAQLENAQTVSVVLMRKGLPVHLKYAIN